MVEIPTRLQNEEFRFLLLTKKSKNPLSGKLWKHENDNNRFKITDEKLLSSFKQGNNYGIIGGCGRLRILDIDDKDLAEELIGKLDTFAVQTCGGTYHFYFLSDYNENHAYEKGEIRSNNYYVVGPGCYAIDEKKGHEGWYKVVKDIKIADISITDMENLLGRLNNDEILKDTSRSGVEWANVMKYMNQGCVDDEINNLMMAFSKWKEAPEAYRKLTLKKARTIYDKEQEDKIMIFEEATIRDKVINFLLLRKEKEAIEIIVQYIINKFNIFTTKNDIKSEVWFYDDGIYKPNGRCFIKEIARDILKVGYTTYRANQVIAKIESDTYIEETELFKNNIIREMPLRNGILNLVTKKISPFTPDKIFFTKIPVIYNKDAKCLKIDEFFNDILKYPEDKKLAYEWFGFCLWKNYFIEQFLMLIGDGRNGKGKFLDLLRRFLGGENVTGLPLSRLNSDSFSLSEMFGKLANVAGDNRDFYLKDTETLKSLIGRDLINGKRKFLTDLNFENYCKQTFACNKLPVVYDNTLGFWSKPVLLEFPYNFLDQDEIDRSTDKEFLKLKDVNIIDTISTDEELSGLLNKALDGLTKIRKNEKFSTTKGSQEVKDFWIRKSNSFMAYCMDNIEEGDNQITKKDLRKKFNAYCKKHKVSGVSDKSIKYTLQSLYGVSELHPASFGNLTREYTWDGIKFKN